jgi:DNA-binding SARP family transcriptional activator/Tfp pilus assembly protein PilF
MGAFAAAAPLSRKARALLAYLALNADSAVPRERLCGLLWSERSEEQARASLRQCLHELRPFAAGPHPLIGIGRVEVTLWSDRAVTDLDEIRALSGVGDASGMADRLAGVAHRLLANLDGLDPAFDEWLQVQRAAIDNQIAAEASACVRANLEDRPTAALRLAESLTSRDPLDEAAARLAMSAAHAAGARGEVQRIWARLEGALQDELGVRPSTESAQTYAALKDAPPPESRVLHRDAGGRSRGRVSIAVLPFADMTAARDHGYFCDGLVVEIATALSRFASLDVVAAGEAGVNFRLEGSVRRDGGKARIAVKLIDARAGGQIWSERFDGAASDLLALEDTVAAAVAGQAASAVHAAQAREIGDRAAADLAPYELYLRAMRRAQDNSREAASEAIALIESVATRDPAFAPALAFAGFCQAITLAYGWSETPRETLAKAIELSRMAVRADGDDPEVLLYAASVTAIVGGDLATAEAMVERSLARNPSAALAWQASGWIKAMGGRCELGLAQFDRAARIDPHSGWLTAHALVGRGCCLLCLGRYDEAVTPLAEAAERLPGERGARIWLAAALAHAGRLAEARAALTNTQTRTIAPALALFRDAAARETIRAGLALAGAEI